MSDLEERSHGPHEVELELHPPRPSDPGPTPIRRLGAGTFAAVGLQHADPHAMRYVLVLQGSFNIGQRAPGTLPITGRVLVISYDADTHEVTDWGVGDQPVDLPGLQPLSL